VNDIAYSYRYTGSSSLHDGLLGPCTFGGSALRRHSDQPLFLAGFVTRPAVVATGLRAVAKVAATKCYRPDQPRQRDPVVTCNGDRLRFESFSGCCGVCSRLDILDVGTTNVDVGERLQRLLVNVGEHDPLRLAVGSRQLAAATTRRNCHRAAGRSSVPMAARPRGGSGDHSRFRPSAELNSSAAGRFLRSLGAARQDGGGSWVLVSNGVSRLSTRPRPGVVWVCGPRRLESLFPLLRYATRLRLYGPAVTTTSGPSSSAWELRHPARDSSWSGHRN
jgi:hypothetical protein